MSQTQSRKDIAINFLKLCSAGHVDEAYKMASAGNFKHHNAYFPGDLNSLKEGMRENAQKNPNKIFEIQCALEDGDKVAVHSKVVLHSPAEMTISVVHILRFEGDKVAEVWDVGMVQPANMVNENGLF